MVRWQFGTGKLSGVEGSGGTQSWQQPASSFANLTNSSKSTERSGGECAWACTAPRRLTRRHSSEVEPGHKVGHKSPVLRDK